MPTKKIIYTIIFFIIAIFLYYYFKPTPIKYFPAKNETIVAFGDSLIQGVGSTDGNDFINLLSKKIDRPIINLGVSGETTAQGMARIDDVISIDPGTVILLFGGNDYLRKIPQEETFTNLKRIITNLQSHGILVILLGVRGGLLVDKFGSDFKKLAKETNVIFVPNILDGLIGNKEYMSSDGIHPNNTGYERMAEKVYKKVYHSI